MAMYSYSRIQSFLTCPAQYQHRYLLKTKPPVPEGVELFMGSRFHEAMEFLYKPAPSPPPLEAVLGHFGKCWDESLQANIIKQKAMGFAEPVRIQKEGMTLADYRQRASGFIENYYRKYEPFDQEHTEAIELRVVFKLDAKGRHMMQGYIDRLAVDNKGALWVHDYKTGQRKLSEEDARNEDQLALYMLGLKQHEKYRDIPEIRLAWHFVAFEEDLVTSERDADELKTLRNRYVHHIQQIESAKQFNTRTNPLCGWCEFLSICADGQAYVDSRPKRNGKREESEKSPSVDTEVLAAAAPTALVPAPDVARARKTPAASLEPALAPELPRKTRIPRGRKADNNQLPLFS